MRGLVLGTDVNTATSKEGLLAWKAISTQRLRYHYVCNPPQMSLDMTESLHFHIMGGREHRHLSWLPTPNLLGPLKEERACRGLRVG